MSGLASARSVSRLTSPDLDALDCRFDELGGSSFFTLIAIDTIADVLSSHELTAWRATISRLLAPEGRIVVGLRSVWYDSAIQPLDYGALADVIELDRLHNPLLTADRLRPSGYVVSTTRDAGWSGIIATLTPCRPHSLHAEGRQPQRQQAN